MHHLPLMLDTPAANLALDEALLDAAETGVGPSTVLRTWEPGEHFVVLGRSSNANAEVDLATCHGDGVKTLQRPSGGGVVVAGPGCLMYAVVLDLDGYPELRAVDQAHAFVLERHARALGPLEPTVRRDGTSDLTLAGDGNARLKFSGNSLRVKRRHLLYHGTLLYDFDLPKIGRWLRSPRREPDYRAARAHRQFVANIPAAREALVEALVGAWQATTPLDDWPRELTAELVRTKYA